MADNPAVRESDEDESVSDMSISLAYRPSPPTMKLYYQWNPSGLRTFYVCGTNQQDRLFAVKLHTGYSLRPPLHDKQGLHLYNGPTTNDPLLAAAGDDSGPLRDLPLNNNSCILLPALDTSGLTKEMMRAYITADKHVAFRFSVEVGCDLKMQRRPFEWRKITKSERDENAEYGGFKLFALPTDHQQIPPNGESSNAGASSSSYAGSGDEVYAIMEWRKFLTSPKHPFDLKFIGSELSEQLGERWSLMVLVTALRLWELHQRGKTHKGSVVIGEKVGPKDKSAH